MTSLTMNAIVNAFIEQKKLTLAVKKCSKIHIGKKCNDCEKLYVHQDEMVESSEVKYLGDILHENGKSKATFPPKNKQRIFNCRSDIGIIERITTRKS